jgi:hypothetical protein
VKGAELRSEIDGVHDLVPKPSECEPRISDALELETVGDCRGVITPREDKPRSIRQSTERIAGNAFLDLVLLARRVDHNQSWTISARDVVAQETENLGPLALVREGENEATHEIES